MALRMGSMLLGSFLLLAPAFAAAVDGVTPDQILIGQIFFGPIAGAPTFRRPHQPLVFPVRAGHVDEFRALPDYARKTGNSRVGFFRADSPTGLQHLENVKRVCREPGMDLVLDLPYPVNPGETQVDKMVAQIGATQAQVVINHGSAGLYGQLIRKTRTAGTRVNFSGVNSGSTEMVHRPGPLAHGMVFAQVVPSPWERKSQVTREYQEEFARQEPGVPFPRFACQLESAARQCCASEVIVPSGVTISGLVSLRTRS